VIILRDVSFASLRAIVEYMYRGEVRLHRSVLTARHSQVRTRTGERSGSTGQYSLHAIVKYTYRGEVRLHRSVLTARHSQVHVQGRGQAPQVSTCYINKPKYKIQFAAYVQ
jgi:hypothetical protein